MDPHADNPFREWEKRKIAGDQLVLIEALLPYLESLSDEEVRSYFVDYWDFSTQLASIVNQWRPKACEESKPKVKVAGR